MRPLPFLLLPLLMIPRAALCAPAAAPVAVPPLAPVDPALAAAPPFFLHDGDRVQICGDSITEQRMYSTLIECYVLSRFPTWHIQFRNTGWSGDGMSMWTRNGVENGFARDIAPLRPTAVLLDYGMNDARGGDANLDVYATSAHTLARHCREIGARLALISPSCEEKYQPGAPAGSAYNLELEKFTARLEQVAKEENVPFVDQLHPMEEVIDSGRKSGILASTEGGPRLVPDSVHPNWGGHLVMAATVLQGLNAPALVSGVTLDATTGAVEAQGATVSQVKTGPTLSFSRLDQASPWPVGANSNVDLALKVPGFTPLDQLSRYLLRVTSLAPGRYTVAVDGVAAGTFDAADLAKGVNLSRAPGPITDAGVSLDNEILAKNELFFQRWRKVQLYEAPAWLPAPQVDMARTAEEQRLETVITAAEVAIDAARQPSPHLWSITPAVPVAP